MLLGRPDTPTKMPAPVPHQVLWRVLRALYWGTLRYNITGIKKAVKALFGGEVSMPAFRGSCNSRVNAFAVGVLPAAACHVAISVRLRLHPTQCLDDKRWLPGLHALGLFYKGFCSAELAFLIPRFSFREALTGSMPKFRCPLVRGFPNPF